MALNFSTLVYLPSQDLFGRTIIITPIASRPGRSGYNARGIFDTRDISIPAEDGSLISDQQTIIDIRESEFAVLPRQRDQIFIPREGNIPEEGYFEVVDSSTNGGGETTLVIRSIGPPRPPFPALGELEARIAELERLVASMNEALERIAAGEF